MKWTEDGKNCRLDAQNKEIKEMPGLNYSGISFVFLSKRAAKSTSIAKSSGDNLNSDMEGKAFPDEILCT